MTMTVCPMCHGDIPQSSRERPCPQCGCWLLGIATPRYQLPDDAERLGVMIQKARIDASRFDHRPIPELERMADQARGFERRAASSTAARDHARYRAQLTAARQRREDAVQEGVSVDELRAIDEEIANAQRRVDLAAPAVERAHEQLRAATEIRQQAERLVASVERYVQSLKQQVARDLPREAARLRDEIAPLRLTAARLEDVERQMRDIPAEIARLTGRRSDG